MSIDEKEMKVLEYLEGELSAEEEKAFLEEVASDPQLQSLLEEYQQQDRVLHAWFDSREAVVKKAPRPDLATLPMAQVEGSIRRRRRMSGIMALAASLVVAGGASVFFMMPRSTPSAVDTIVYAEGRPQVFEPKATAPEDLGKLLPEEVAALKTPARSQLEVSFKGGIGSFEMKENSTVRVAERGSAVELGLDRGEVLVFARNPMDADATRTVRVQTPYFEARSDRGTFNVVRGLKGAEVAVVSGEVELMASGSRRTLSRGDRYSSTDSEPMPLASRVEWSRHSDQLIAMLPADQRPAPAVVASVTEAPALSETIAEPEADVVAMAAPAKATVAEVDDSRVMVRSNTATFTPTIATTNFLPANTLSVIEIPSVPKMLESSGKRNFAEAVFESGLRQYLEESAANALPTEENMADVNEALDKVFGNQDVSLVLGSLTGSISIGFNSDGVVLIADVIDNYAQVQNLINNTVEPKVAENESCDDCRPRLTVENGRLIVAAGMNAEQFAATVDAVRYSQPTPFAQSEFLTEVRQTVPNSYFTAALDAKSLFAVATGGTDENHRMEVSRFFQNAGLANMHSVIAATSFRDQAQNQALRITFDGERQGVMSWLDTPGPMSSFQYYSPDTHALIAMRVKTPSVILDEFFTWIGQEGGAVPDTDPEVALVKKIAATLGNEAAIGLDNPVLPTPNVKVALEVLDPEGFHDAMVELLDMMWAENSTLQKVEVNAEDYRNHLVVDFTYPGSNLGISYSVIGDFVVLGPGRPFLQDAINMYVEGQTLNNEYSFQQALPAKSGSYCSMLMYAAHNPSMSDAAPVLTELLRQNNIPISTSPLEKSDTATDGAVYYIIAEQNQIDLFIEGIRGDYAMSGMIPAVASWIESNSAE